MRTFNTRVHFTRDTETGFERAELQVEATIGGVFSTWIPIEASAFVDKEGKPVSFLTIAGLSLKRLMAESDAKPELVTRKRRDSEAAPSAASGSEIAATV